LHFKYKAPSINTFCFNDCSLIAANVGLLSAAAGLAAQMLIYFSKLNKLFFGFLTALQPLLWEANVVGGYAVL